MYRYLLIAAMLGGIVLRLTAQQCNTWSQESVFAGSARKDAVAMSYGRQILIATGEDATGLKKDLWAYDTGQKTWTQLADLPAAAKARKGAVANEDFLMLGFGEDNQGNLLKDCYIYDYFSNSWSATAVFPGLARKNASSFSAGWYPYFATGKTGANSCSDELYYYDWINNAWVQQRDYPGGGIESAVSFSYDGRAYVGMGRNANGTGQAALYEYIESSNSWVQRDNFSGAARVESGTFCLGATAYVVGGTSTTTGNGLSDVYSYSISQDDWQRVGLFGAGTFESGIAVESNRQGYVGLGEIAGQLSRALYHFAPCDTTIWTGSQSSSFTRNGNWSNGAPASGTVIRIPANTANNPATSYRHSIKDMIMENGSVISIASGDQLQLSGNFTSLGNASVNGNGILVFNGSDQQSINGSATISRLEIDNGEELLLSDDITITESIALGNGNLVLNGSELEMAIFSKINGGSADGYIVMDSASSIVKKSLYQATNFNFPVGYEEYAPLDIEFSQGSPMHFTLKLKDEAYENASTSSNAQMANAVAATWSVEASRQQSVSLKTHWPAAIELPGFDRNNAFLALSSENDPQWDMGSSGASAQNGNLFSKTRGTTLEANEECFLSLASAGSALPVDLLSFTLNGTSKGVKLQWQTAMEENSEYFEIQRSENAQDWMPIGQVEAAGNSLQLRAYRFIDQQIQASSRLYYYRLKQVDIDGAYEFSDIITWDAEMELSKPELNIYPSVATHSISYNLTEQPLDAWAISTSGVRYSLGASIKAARNKLFVQTLPAGSYVLFFETQMGALRARLIKR